MIELITIIVLLGILAVVAIPRMDTAASFRAVEFRDTAIAALRFAQKTATSHRRLVCVAFAGDSVTLTIDSDKSGACDTALPMPGSNSNVVQSGDTVRGVFAATPAALFFQPDGRGTTDAPGNTTAPPIDTTIDGMRFVVTGATGYVGDGS